MRHIYTSGKFWGNCKFGSFSVVPLCCLHMRILMFVAWLYWLFALFRTNTQTHIQRENAKSIKVALERLHTNVRICSVINERARASVRYRKRYIDTMEPIKRGGGKFTAIATLQQSYVCALEVLVIIKQHTTRDTPLYKEEA